MPLSIRHAVEDDGTLRIVLEGCFTVQDGKAPFQLVRDMLLDTVSCRRVFIDLRGLHHADSAWIAFLALVKDACRARNLPLELSGDAPGMHGLLQMLDLDALEASATSRDVPSAPGFFVRAGAQTLEMLHQIRFILAFVGQIVLTLLAALRNPRRVRMGDMMTALQRNGVDALPIITLINFLVGIVLAFQASIQLSQFGANIYVANLVGIAQTREFGPMITAIILAGRSGSAFAAEIGSMKVNEEVDALTTMGLEPVRFLVVPKMLALLIAMPILTLVADFMGILGGLVVGVTSLDLTVQGYLIQTRKAVSLFDVFSGLTKSFAFAFIVSGIGCLRGFQTRGGADSVGQAATSAVVSGIFLIILADAIFTVLFQYV